MKTKLIWKCSAPMVDIYDRYWGTIWKKFSWGLSRILKRGLDNRRNLASKPRDYIAGLLKTKDIYTILETPNKISSCLWSVKDQETLTQNAGIYKSTASVEKYTSDSLLANTSLKNFQACKGHQTGKPTTANHHQTLHRNKTWSWLCKDRCLYQYPLLRCLHHYGDHWNNEIFRINLQSMGIYSTTYGVNYFTVIIFCYSRADLSLANIQARALSQPQTITSITYPP